MQNQHNLFQQGEITQEKGKDMINSNAPVDNKLIRFIITVKTMDIYVVIELV